MENDFTSEVHSYNLIENTWNSPIVGGRPPSPRGDMSMTLVRDQIWIFGGYTPGSTLNDIYVLNLANNEWRQAELAGVVPRPRQSHTAVSLSEKLYIMGGCDYSRNTCYNELWTFDINFMRFSLINDVRGMTLAIGHSTIIGDIIYFFGSCWMNTACEANFYKFELGVGCASNCTNQGVCKDNRCICNDHYFGMK